VFLDALTVIAKPVSIHFTWRPQLTDPADEMVLETAINGQAKALVSVRKTALASISSLQLRSQRNWR
jgi:predicted nucleic acid-binding protein